MIGSLRVIAAPSEEPLSPEELRQHLRLPDATEDGVLSSYLTAVRAQAEALLDAAFLRQTLECAFDAFPWADFYQIDSWNYPLTSYLRSDTGYPFPAMELPRPPLVSVTSITYVDPTGATQTLSAGLYQVDTRSTPGRIVPVYGQSWPATRPQPSAIVVKYLAGAASPADMPEDQKQILRLAVATLYEYRESLIAGGAQSVGLMEQLFAPYRSTLLV